MDLLIVTKPDWTSLQALDTAVEFYFCNGLASSTWKSCNLGKKNGTYSSPLTRTRFVTNVKEALSKTGVDATGYSGDSFGAGAATTAARQGVGNAMIKMLGRWKSCAYQLYIKTPQEQLAAYSCQLGGDPHGKGRSMEDM